MGELQEQAKQFMEILKNSVKAYGSSVKDIIYFKDCNDAWDYVEKFYSQVEYFCFDPSLTVRQKQFFFEFLCRECPFDTKLFPCTLKEYQYIKENNSGGIVYYDTKTYLDVQEQRKKAIDKNINEALSFWTIIPRKYFNC